jgi:predicted O-methyltransferase YrrM
VTIIPELDGTYPWWVWGAVDHVKAVLQPDWRVFEWGGGGSTLWFAQRVKHITTVENDYDWATKTSRELAQYGLSNALIVFEDNLARYADEITSEQLPLDLVAIDGRNRAKCIWHARSKVKPGGYLVLDNSERAEYQDAMLLLDHWQRWDFDKTPQQGGYAGWRTTVWRRPE